MKIETTRLSISSSDIYIDNCQYKESASLEIHMTLEKRSTLGANLSPNREEKFNFNQFFVEIPIKSILIFEEITIKIKCSLEGFRIEEFFTLILSPSEGNSLVLCHCKIPWMKFIYFDLLPLIHTRTCTHI